MVYQIWFNWRSTKNRSKTTSCYFPRASTSRLHIEKNAEKILINWRNNINAEQLKVDESIFGIKENSVEAFKKSTGICQAFITWHDLGFFEPRYNYI